MAEAGKGPTNAPASLPASASHRERAAASSGRRRSIMWAAFWPGSAAGFMLGSHEAPVSRLIARLALRACPLRWPRPTCASRRTGRRLIPTGRCPAVSPSTCSRRRPTARLRHASADRNGPRGTAARQTDDFRYQSCTVTPENDSTFQNPEAVNIAVIHQSAAASRGRHHDDRRRPARGRAELRRASPCRPCIAARTPWV